MSRRDDFLKLASQVTKEMKDAVVKIENFAINNKGKILNSVLDVIPTTFPNDGKGNFKSDADATKALSAFRNNIKNALKATGLQKQVDEYVKVFSKVEQLNLNIASSFFNATDTYIEKFILSLKRGDLQNRTIANVYENCFGMWLDGQFTNTLVKDILKPAIDNKERIVDTIAKVKEKIVGGGANPKLINHYIQTARDAVGQYNGAFQNQFAKDFKLNAFIYVGPEVTKTRLTCIELLEKPFHLMVDIPEIIKKYENNPGWNAATTPETFFAFRGGYGCQHQCFAYYATEEEIKALKNEEV
jgi:hypothetical protein